MGLRPSALVPMLIALCLQPMTSMPQKITRQVGITKLRMTIRILMNRRYLFDCAGIVSQVVQLYEVIRR